MGLCGLPRPVWNENPTLDHLLDHCDHPVKTVGDRHAGLGPDYAEGYKDANVLLPVSIRNRTLRPDIFGTVDDFLNQDYPRGIETIRLLPKLTQGMLDRGYSKDGMEAILGGNWLRNFEEVVG